MMSEPSSRKVRSSEMRAKGRKEIRRTVEVCGEDASANQNRAWKSVERKSHLHEGEYWHEIRRKRRGHQLWRGGDATSSNSPKMKSGKRSRMLDRKRKEDPEQLQTNQLLR